MNYLMLSLLAFMLAGCAANQKEPVQSSNPQVLNGNDLIEKVRKRDGAKFIGVYLGMIAEWDGLTNKWDPKKMCFCGDYMPQGVQMFSATSGELLKWIPYEDFRDIFILKIKPEYSK